MSEAAARKGTLYGVGVGPGDPELLTRKAVRVLESCPVIAAPQTAGEKTLALDIAAAAADLSQKTILYLQFPMTRNQAQLAENYQKQADRLAEVLAAGQDVAVLSLGDVSVYSTFCYLMERLADRFPVQMVPGVPSFCAGAAALCQSLTTASDPLCIVPAGAMPLETALALPGTRVLMKSGRQLPGVVETLRQAGLGPKTALVQNCGLPGQRLCPALENEDYGTGYFTTLIIKE